MPPRARRSTRWCCEGGGRVACAAAGSGRSGRSCIRRCRAERAHHPTACTARRANRRRARWRSPSGRRSSRAWCPTIAVASMRPPDRAAAAAASRRGDGRAHAPGEPTSTRRSRSCPRGRRSWPADRSTRRPGAGRRRTARGGRVRPCRPRPSTRCERPAGGPRADPVSPWATAATGPRRGRGSPCGAGPRRSWRRVRRHSRRDDRRPRPTARRRPPCRSRTRRRRAGWPRCAPGRAASHTAWRSG